MILDASRFTPIGGQDKSQPLPYDPSNRLETQIKTSFQTSLDNLRTSYLDSLLLHSPLNTLAQTITAWKTLMALQDSGKVKFIGVSNTYDVAVLETLERIGGRRVQIVQNRWFEGNQWDTDVLEYCLKNKVQYQSVPHVALWVHYPADCYLFQIYRSFWTLTGSPNLLAHPELLAFAKRKGLTAAQVEYRLAQSRGVTPISGTTQESHMQHDIAVGDLALEDEDKSVFNSIASWMGLT